MDLDAIDDEVEAALWDYLLHVDLVVSITASNRPVDEPLRWRLADQRRVHVDGVYDHLWVRVVDPAVALAARRYATDDSLVLELVDPFRPDNDGCWLVEGVPDGAVATRTHRARRPVARGARARQHLPRGSDAERGARCRRVRESTPGALPCADAFFAVAPVRGARRTSD